jgi:hypothetical protein
VANLNTIPPIAVVFKEIKRKKEIVHVKVFENTRFDDVVDGNKRKPLIPHEFEILDIGIGKVFEEKYKKKYKL